MKRAFGFRLVGPFVSTANPRPGIFALCSVEGHPDGRPSALNYAFVRDQSHATEAACDDAMAGLWDLLNEGGYAFERVMPKLESRDEYQKSDPEAALPQGSWGSAERPGGKRDRQSSEQEDDDGN